MQLLSFWQVWLTLSLNPTLLCWHAGLYVATAGDDGKVVVWLQDSKMQVGAHSTAQHCTD